MSKANFLYDPSYPLVDSAGHSDKLSFFNVKGGGSTNTTLFDPPSSGVHYLQSARSYVGVSATLGSCRLDPDLNIDASGFWQLSNPGCLNAVDQGDYLWTRCGDTISLDRIEISGCVSRFGGAWADTAGQSDPNVVAFPYYSPKAFVALVLDTQADRAVPPTGVDLDAGQNGPFTIGGAMNVAATNFVSAVPFLELKVPPNRFRVLAFDVLDFDGPVNRCESVVHWEGNEAGYPVTTSSVDTIRTSYSWQTISRGFRFDVDLNGVLCHYFGTGASISNVVDNALHMYVLNFDSANEDGRTLSSNAPESFGYLSCQYTSRLSFRDQLMPRSFSEAGADGGVVADEAPDLTVLADQSAILAGLPALPDSPVRRPKKKSKASEGYYNFRPSAGAGDLFADDPEVALLPDAPDGSALPSRRWKTARFGDFEHQGSYYGERKRWDPRNRRPSKRGKY